MTRLSLSDLALRIKTMKVNLGSTIEDVLTRALDPPSATNIRRAVSVLVEVRSSPPSKFVARLIAPHPGSRAHPDRGYYTVGSSPQQTPDRRSPWEILAYCYHLPLLGSSSHDRCCFVLQVSVPGSIWFGRRCGSREGSIQGQELRFLDDTQRF